MKKLLLLRFATTHTGDAEQSQSLEEYVARMKEGQEKIYYIAAENFNTAKQPAPGKFSRKKGIEALLLTDRMNG